MIWELTLWGDFATQYDALKTKALAKNVKILHEYQDECVGFIFRMTSATNTHPFKDDIARSKGKIRVDCYKEKAQKARPVVSQHVPPRASGKRKRREERRMGGIVTKLVKLSLE